MSAGPSRQELTDMILSEVPCGLAEAHRAAGVIHERLLRSSPAGATEEPVLCGSYKGSEPATLDQVSAGLSCTACSHQLGQHQRTSARRALEPTQTVSFRCQMCNCQTYVGQIATPPPSSSSGRSSQRLSVPEEDERALDHPQRSGR